MTIATAIVVTLTAAASFVGAQMAGILACFPVFATILAVFAHRMRGPEMAMQVLRGMVLSLYGFATFFFLIGLIIVEVGDFAYVHHRDGQLIADAVRGALFYSAGENNPY